MYTIFIFLGGFIFGLILVAILRLQTEKNKKEHEKIIEKEAENRRIKQIKNRRKNSLDKNSKTLKKFKLKSLKQPYNAYFSNDEVFIAFYFKYLNNPQLPKIGEKEMIKFNELELCGIYEHTFSKILEKGDVLIFSKAEGKLVNEIMREDRGDYLNHKPEIPQFYEYYLPDGTLFFNTMNFHVNLGPPKQKDSLVLKRKLKNWFGKLLP